MTSRKPPWGDKGLPKGCMGIDPDRCTGACAMGIDQRPGSWDVAIGDVVRPSPDCKVARLLFYGKVRDDEEVEFLAHRYRVIAGVGDCRPDVLAMARMAQRLRYFGKDFWRVQYNPGSGVKEMTKDEHEHSLTIDRLMTLDEVFFAANSLGLALPTNFREICGTPGGTSSEFVRELTNPTRIPAMQRGEETYAWTKGSDHAFHALGYLFVALKIGKLFDGNGSSPLMTTPGITKGMIASPTEGGEDQYVDPMGMPGEPMVSDDGRMVWSDGFGENW